MGKRNRVKEARRLAARDALGTVLRAHTGRPEAAPETYGDFSQERRRAIDAFAAHALRAPEDWRCRIKSRAEDRRFLDLVRFCFARYRVPPHLEAIWLDDISDDFVDRVAPIDPRAPHPWGRPDLRAWSIIAGQGGSLYRQAARPYLSRSETHHFLNAPPELAHAGAALWYAVARAEVDDAAVALRVARSKLVSFSVASAFWKEAARYFARHRLATAEIDDLVDFLLAARRDDDGFALKGRSLAALRRRMEEWHRALRKEQAVCGGAWPGRPIADADYRAGGERKTAIWRFRQIKTGNDLFREGQRMRHCVVTYKQACLQGSASIWSLTCEFPLGQINKGVTLEVRADGAIVQCRGFANRLPYANEVAMVKRWADDHGLVWRAIG